MLFGGKKSRGCCCGFWREFPDEKDGLQEMSGRVEENGPRTAAETQRQSVWLPPKWLQRCMSHGHVTIRTRAITAI